MNTLSSRLNTTCMHKINGVKEQPERPETAVDRKQQRVCTVQQQQQGDQGLGKVLNEHGPLETMDQTTKEPLVGRMQV